MAAIRLYEVTTPATSGELRQKIGAAIGAGAAKHTVEVSLNEVGVDIPAADARTGLTFRVKQFGAPEDRDEIVRAVEIGPDGEASGHTVDLRLSTADEMPATLTLTTDD
jgi:hypothetical protein